MVACFAAQLYGEKMNLPDEETQMYKPSERWSFWFMCVQMNLSMRKVCGTPVSPQAMEKQDIGMHLFPQARWMWVHKGDSEVKGSLAEDKRQYTGDIVHNVSPELFISPRQKI